MPLVLLIGGARSGKSALAMRLAANQHRPVVFIATGEARDLEMTERIAKHRLERPDSWETIEEPVCLHEAIQGVSQGSCMVIDCLTLWTANALERLGAAKTRAAAGVAANAAAARPGLTVAVTNEVGLGVIPDNALARSYQDLLGQVNAIWAETADRALLLVAGRALALAKSELVIDDLL